VIIYERPTTDHIRRIHHVVVATTLRWTFEGGMRETAQEALVLLRHEAEEQMEQSQYCHFLSRAWEEAKAMVMPAGDRDHIGCFIDQVKLTCPLVREFDEAIKEVNLLGEHEEKSSQRSQSWRPCARGWGKMLSSWRRRRPPWKEWSSPVMSWMIQSRDELIIDMAKEYGLNHMEENNDDED
jgi:hypothetical protein